VKENVNKSLLSEHGYETLEVLNVFKLEHSILSNQTQVRKEKQNTAGNICVTLD
jgi:hypothetical protein